MGPKGENGSYRCELVLQEQWVLQMRMGPAGEKGSCRENVSYS